MKYLMAMGLAATLFTTGCGGDSGKTPAVTADGGTTPPPSAPAAGPQGTSVVVWMEDMSRNRTDDKSAPDSVDDKTVLDTEDPAAFDGFLPR